MECLVGITQNPDEKLGYWKKKYPTLRSWEILEKFTLKSEARSSCDHYATKLGCGSYPEDGDFKGSEWSVYCFKFGEPKVEIKLRDTEGEVCTVMSLKKLKELLEEEMEFLLEQLKEVSKLEDSTVDKYHDCVALFSLYTKAIEQLIYNSATVSDDEFHQRSKELATKIPDVISSRWVWSKRPFHERSAHFKKTMDEWEERMSNLENLYQEKLRLEGPAAYWRSTGRKYMWQGILLLVFVGSISGIGLLWLVSYFNDWLRGDDVILSLHTIQGAVIFASLMAIFAFVVRIFSRLAFNSFHLMRDAQEREQLTYLYLSLSEDDESLRGSREIILRALFSRSQTGLLANERGPAMLATDLVRSDK